MADRDKVVEIPLSVIVYRIVQILSLIAGTKNIAIWINALAYEQHFIIGCFIMGCINLWSIFYLEGVIDGTKTKSEDEA